MNWKYIRHAQPESDYSDINLTLENETLPIGEVGKQQSIQLAISENSCPFKVLLASEFTRATGTAFTIANTQEVGAEVVTLPELNEVRFGNPTRAELKKWINTGEATTGEKVADVRKRVRFVLKKINTEYLDIRGAIVAHKLLYSVFLLEAEGHRLDAPISQLRNNYKLNFCECVDLSSLFI